MTEFEIWFEIQKVTTGKGKELEPLRNLFEECWNKASEKVTELENEIEELQESFEMEKDDLYTEDSLNERVWEIKQDILDVLEARIGAFKESLSLAIKNLD